MSVTLHLSVPDADAAVDRAVAAGATLSRPVADAPYGRTGAVERQSFGLSALCRDDQGLPFWLGQLG